MQYPATCQVTGCEEPHYGQRLCRAHYRQWRRRCDREPDQDPELLHPAHDSLNFPAHLLHAGPELEDEAQDTIRKMSKGYGSRSQTSSCRHRREKRGSSLLLP